VAYRPFDKHLLYKQLPLLGNVRNIQARNNRMTGLRKTFLSNGSVNTFITIGVLLETVFYVRSVQNGCKQEFSWELAVEFRSSKWEVSRELGSAREAEEMALWVQLWSLNKRAMGWPRKAKNLHCVKSVVRKRLVETVIGWGHCSLCVSEL
jgi:hypothetical protein